MDGKTAADLIHRVVCKIFLMLMVPEVAAVRAADRRVVAIGAGLAPADEAYLQLSSYRLCRLIIQVGDHLQRSSRLRA